MWGKSMRVNLCGGARRERRERPPRGAALVVVGALTIGGLSACGSADSGGSTPASPAPVAQATGTSTPSATSPKQPRTDSVLPRTARPLPTKKVSVDAPVGFGTGAQIALEKLRIIQVKPETPGEVAGPAVAVTVVVTNLGTSPLNLDSAVVSLEAADGELGIATTAGRSRPLRGDLRPGAHTKGVYVFMLDPARQREVRVNVNYAAGDPVAIFSGKTP